MCIRTGPEHRECSPSPYGGRTGTIMALSQSVLTGIPINTRRSAAKRTGWEGEDY